MVTRLIHNVTTLITNFSIRTEQKDGNSYIVIPIVALVEGVHNGSGGAAFYSAAEISRTAQQWNGVPLTIDHPKDGAGSPITANNPETLKKYAVGTFENVRYEDGKLKGEGYILKDRMEVLSPTTMAILAAGMHLEVSTGLFTKTDNQPGFWKGEKFEESVSDFVPDHLALLPDAEGACNYEAGCGVRNNKLKNCKGCKFNEEGGGANDMKKSKGIKITMDDGAEAKTTFGEVFRELKQAGFWVNEISHSKVREQLFKLVSDMSNQGSMHFLREVFNDHFIFEEIKENDSKLFSLKFKIKDDEVILGNGDRVEVKEKVDFIPINNIQGDLLMKRTKAVEALIANEKLPFTEADSELLTNMDKEAFERLFTLNECGCKDGEEELMKVNAENEALKATNKELEEKLITNKKSEEDKSKEPVTLDSLLANASPEVRENWEEVQREAKQRKDKLIETILALKDNQFEKKDLEEMTTNMLKKIISVVPVANYSGNGSKKTTETIINLNERQKDGSGVPKVKEAKFNADGTPDFSCLVDDK